MRARWSVTCAFVVILVCVSSITAERYAIQARQDNGASQSPSGTQSAALSTAGSSRAPQSSDNAKSTGASSSDGFSASSKSSASSGSPATSATDSMSSGAATSSNSALSSTESASSIASSTAPGASATAAVNDLSPSVYQGRCLPCTTNCIADFSRQHQHRSDCPSSATKNHTCSFSCWCPDDGIRHGVHVDRNQE